MVKRNVIHQVDALEGLKTLPDGSVDCVMTSPPYWAMRDYGVSGTNWPDGSTCALGHEPTCEEYVEHLCSIFSEAYRVLKPTGTVWVNLSDTYAGSWGAYSKDPAESRISNAKSRGTPSPRPPSSFRQSVRKKSLCLIPERFVLRMAEEGWILRNRIVWRKLCPMPSSAKDRLTPTWEYLFLFTKESRYFFDLDAVRVPHVSRALYKTKYDSNNMVRKGPSLRGGRRPPSKHEPGAYHPLGKNPGDCWDISPSSLRGSHIAVYPEKLCEMPILAGCPRKVCRKCGVPPLKRFVRGPPRMVKVKGDCCKKSANKYEHPETCTPQEVMGCSCKVGFQSGIVLDPFMGSGTTAVVARRMGRDFIGFELNPDYVRLGRGRVRDV